MEQAVRKRRGRPKRRPRGKAHPHSAAQQVSSIERMRLIREAASTPERVSQRAAAAERMRRIRAAANTPERAAQRAVAVRRTRRRRRAVNTPERVSQRAADAERVSRIRSAANTPERVSQRAADAERMSRRRSAANTPERVSQRAADAERMSRRRSAANTPARGAERAAAADRMRRRRVSAGSPERRGNRERMRRRRSSTQSSLNEQEQQSDGERLRALGWDRTARERQHIFEFIEKDRVLTNLPDQACITCSESYRGILLKGNGECERCFRDKNPTKGLPKRFSAANGMIPSPVPQCLQALTMLEQMLIAIVIPEFTMIRLSSGGQYAYKGHSISFEHDIRSWVTEVLPRSPGELDGALLTIRKPGSRGTYADFRVRREQVENALRWLSEHNPCYKDVVISSARLDALPNDGNLMEQLPARDYEGNVTDGEEAEDLEAAEEEVNTHTCVPDLDIDENERSRAAQAVVNFPARGEDPISDAYPDFFTKAYPVLFPNGDADFNARGTGRLVKVTLREWAAHLLRLADKRFDNHPRFRFTVYNRFIRQRALQVTQVFVKQQGLSSDYTIAQLLQAVRSNDLTIVRRLFYYGSSIVGSRAWKSRKRQELLSMINQLGLPIYFLTFSCGDHYWPQIQPDPTASAKDRNKFINDNPSTCVSVFIERFRILLDSFLLPAWGLKDYFWIIEYQHRGSIHIHGLAWQDPHQVQQYDHSKLHQHLSQGAGHEVEDAVEFFDHYISAWNDCKLRSDEVRRALEGDDTVNPDPVPRGYSKPEVHPSTLLYNPSTTTDDLTACLMSFQRHTICKRTTCLRTKRGSLQCRMLFPKPLRETSGFGQEEGRSDGSLSFIPRRNDPKVNQFNPTLVRLWRANMDIKACTSTRQVVNYIMKYITKNEPASGALQALTSMISSARSRNLSPEDPSVRALRRLLIGCCTRDVSSQEVSHCLLGLPPVICSREFQTATIEPTSAVVNLHGDDETISSTSFWQRYLNRPEEFNDWAFVPFMREYRYIGGRWRKRRNKNIIVRVFPLANDPGNDTFWRTLCLGSIPLRSVAECKGDFPTWRERAMDAADEGISLGWDLAHTDAIAGRASGEPADLQGSESSGSDSDRDSEEERYQDEYMRIFAPGILSYVSEPTQAQLMSFAEERRRVAEEGFVDYPKAESFVESVREFRPEVGFDGIDPGDLNTKQRVAYDHIVSLLSNAAPSDSKACFLHGVGGTGKTALISTVVKACLETYGEASFMVLAPTGKAASLLPFGVTLHAGLKLPVPLTESTFEPLEGEALAALQDSARDLRLVIIDEISMVGCRFIAAIDSRLRQMRPDHRASPFGGVVTVLSGDMGQLPPVLDKPLYSKEAPGESFMCTQGRLVCSSVTKAIFLDQIMRTDQLDFQAMLQRIRDGDQTDEDHSVFLERELYRLPAIERADFEDSILLSSTRDRAAEINKTQLDNLPGYLVDCRAIHVGRGAAGASEEQARGLSSRLQLKIGVPVMLTANLAVACGLTNGSMGHVFGFMTAENDDNSSTLPVVLVQFPSYRGPSFNNLKPQVVPISPVSRVWQSGPHTCSRTQLPLTLAFASTIYKAQGSSLSRYLIDIGSKEIGLGSTYVALSRAKSLQSFAVHVTDRRNLSLARWKKIGRGKGAIERKSFEDHLRSLEFSE